MDNFSRILSRPVAASLIAGVSTYFLSGGEVVEVYGYQIPSAVVIAAAVGLASAANGTVKEAIIPALGVDPIGQTAQMIVSPAVTGVVTIGAIMLMNGFKFPDKAAIIQFGLLGAASEIGGDYVSNAVAPSV